jgi:SHAQKYF class myb-like DNA-binding protein
MDGIEKSRRKSYVVRRKEYWTEEEHERFLAGLEQFGCNWRAIERIVDQDSGTSEVPRSKILYSGSKEERTGPFYFTDCWQ